MDRAKTRPAPNGARNQANTFERTRPQPGRRSGSYSRNVSSPRAAREEKQRLYFLLALLVVLPPVGIACLWRGGFLRLAYRAAATGAAFLLMILYFSWMLPEKTLSTIAPDNIKRPAAVTAYSPSSSMYDQTGDR
ncbi:MAG: hypothetical protein IIW08_00420 [Clostridia bacterium]|nr:hypothetical protein [Clostridia bacterium]MBQ2433839.1 hypothetical protein [Clostridia bacterium]MBQ5769620.1 hypothetical protein [Clostridia bacterium]